jgi:hypothetical protein
LAVGLDGNLPDRAECRECTTKRIDRFIEAQIPNKHLHRSISSFLIGPCEWAIHATEKTGGILSNAAVQTLYFWDRLPAVLAGAAATATAIAGTKSAATARPALGPGAGFIHRKCSAIEVFAVDAVDRGVAFGFAGHFHKGEAPGLPCFPVSNDVNALDGPVRLKHGTYRIFGSSETEVSYKNVLHFTSFWICRAAN